MKVLLLQDVPGVGKRNTVIEVKDGYGRNYLIAQGLARLADQHVLHQAAVRETAHAARQANKKAQFEEYLKQLGELTLTIRKKANEKGVLFAAITADEIVDLLHKRGFSLVEKGSIGGVPLKSVGTHAVIITLEKKAVTISVHVEQS